MTIADLTRAINTLRELDDIYRRFPRLASFRPSCDCCSELVIERHYGGEDAVLAWRRVQELRASVQDLSPDPVD